MKLLHKDSDPHVYIRREVVANEAMVREPRRKHEEIKAELEVFAQKHNLKIIRLQWEPNTYTFSDLIGAYIATCDRKMKASQPWDPTWD